MASPEEDFTSLPLSEKITHKNWKARQGAYEDLIKKFRTLDPDATSEYKKLSNYLPKAVVDANLVAQETALSALIAYIENAPEPATPSLASSIIEKCLASTRNGTKQKALDSLILYVEVENNSVSIIEELIQTLGHKSPKNVGASVNAIKELLRLYGTKIVNIKPILKQLPKIFDHKDKSVRSEGISLAIELYRWLGPAMMGSLNDLKPVQLKELNEEFSKLENVRTVPDRYVKADQERMAATVSSSENNEHISKGGQAQNSQEPIKEVELDPYELNDPVNVLEKMPKKFYDELASTNWKERKGALENLYTVLNTPKIEDGRFFDLISALSKRMSDANIPVVILAANCIQALAKGLRDSFSQYASNVIGPILERCKEKKQNVLDSLRAALDAVFLTRTVDQIVEDIVVASSHKNPQIRSESLQWLIRSLKVSNKQPGKAEFKSYTDAAMKAIDDSDHFVRETAAEALGTLMKVMGERYMLPYMEKLDTIKSGKVREFYSNAQVKCSTGAMRPKSTASVNVNGFGGVGKPIASSAVKPTEKENTPPASLSDYKPESKSSRPGSRPVTALSRKASTKSSGVLTSAQNKTGAKSSLKKTKSTTIATSKQSAVVEESPVQFRFTDDAAENYFIELFGQSVFDQLSDSVWKVRLAAMQSIFETIKNQIVSEIEAEAICRVFLNKPGWKENNFQVATSMINTFCYLAKEVPSFTKGCVSLITPGLADKVGDMKVKKVAGECLGFCAESSSLGFVLSNAYDIWQKQKSPKTLADSLSWVSDSLVEFGISGVSIKSLIEYTKLCLTNTNPNVRNEAVRVFCLTQLLIGNDIRNMIQDVSSSLLSTIDSELEKLSSQPLQKPTRIQNKNASTNTKKSSVPTTGGSERDSAKSVVNASQMMEEDPLDEIMPRVNVSSELTGQIVSDLGDTQWKVRKAALDQVVQILEASNKRIKPVLGSDFVASLKARLNDSNKNLVMQTLEICGLLAISMGKPFEKYGKFFLTQMASCYADQKVHVRNTVTSSLNTVYSIIGLSSMVQPLSQTLVTDQPILRKDLLTWLVEKLESEYGNESNIDSSNMPDMECLVQPLLSCLQDRVSDNRKSAQTSLRYVSANVGFDTVRQKGADMFQGAQLQSIMPFLDSLQPSGSSTSSSTNISASTNGNNSSSTSQTKATKVPGTPKRGSSIASRSKTSLPNSTSSVNMKSMNKKSNSVESISSTNTMSDVPPLWTSDSRAKDQRADKNAGLTKWVFIEAPRKELIQLLEEQCEGNLSPDLIRLLFSTDHYKEKSFLQGLTVLDDFLVNLSSNTFGLSELEVKQRVIVNTDLILKYLTIRFFDTNTIMLIKCLDLCEHLFALLDNEGYQWSDYEASVFLPFIVNKTGDSKETMRVKIRIILRQVYRLYPASKVFIHLVEGLKSKNARTRMECLDELAFLVKRNGFNVCSAPSKIFPLIATQISDRDSGVRNAAINVVLQAYLLIGEQVYKYLGRLNEKDKGMLDEKIKRLPSQQQTSPSNNVATSKENITNSGKSSPAAKRTQSPARASAGSPNSSKIPRSDKSKRTFSLDLEELGIPKAIDFASLKKDDAFESTLMHSIDLAETQEEMMVDLLITQITSSDAKEVLQSLTDLEKHLGTHSDVLESRMDDLITALILQMRLTLAPEGPPTNSQIKVCKLLMSVIIQLFSKPALMGYVSKGALSGCITELLGRLKSSNESTDFHAFVSKNLNVMMVRILEHANKNHTFSVLLNLLEVTAKQVRFTAPEDLQTEVKYMDLIMKCLWKNTKMLRALVTDPAFNVPQLLLDLHLFLAATPPIEWKRRAAEKIIPQADMPLRTAKTILHELVLIFEEKIFDHINLIEETISSHAVAYLKQLLDTERKKKGLDPYEDSRLPSSLTRSTSLHSHLPVKSRAQSQLNSVQASPAGVKRPMSVISASNSSHSITLMNNSSSNYSNMTTSNQSSAGSQLKSPFKKLNEEEVRARVENIFQKISSKELTKTGIQELYEFSRQYPYAETLINESISKTGPFVQGYIRRSLSALSLQTGEPTTASMAHIIHSTTAVVSGDQGVAVDRFGMQHVNGASAGTGGEDADHYREKLARLQRLFDHQPKDEIVMNAADTMPTSKRFSSAILATPDQINSIGNSSNSASSTVNTQPSNPAATSVAQLKERLAKMKLNMGK